MGEITFDEGEDPGEDPDLAWEAEAVPDAGDPTSPRHAFVPRKEGFAVGRWQCSKCGLSLDLPLSESPDALPEMLPDGRPNDCAEMAVKAVMES